MAIRNKYYEVTVNGRGKFPLDMLRYSRAFPVTEADAATMEFDSNNREDYRRRRTVRIGLHAGNYLTAFNCCRRFESFGWKAEVTFEERVAG